MQTQWSDEPTIERRVCRKIPVRDIQRGTVNIVSVSNLKNEIKAWTKQVYDNIPYKDDYLTMARPPKEPSVVPQQVGAGSPIKHVIYVIKERIAPTTRGFRRYQEGNGDPRLAIFGEKITPNHTRDCRSMGAARQSLL